MCTVEIRHQRTLPAVDCLGALHYETLFTDGTQKIGNSSTEDTHTRLSHSYFTLFLGHYKKTLFFLAHPARDETWEEEEERKRERRASSRALPERKLFLRWNWKRKRGRGRQMEATTGSGTAVLLPPLVDDGSGYPVFLFPPLLRYTTELN